ncbi:Rhodanese-like domain-containing protein [Melia azedarach]|uniref:Rhodanese-like domain-containing protein n=1 Tax=Melia azedarach TaxID=155640 RepID=A0ACC1XT92_MELAZ|nr:Rhodanese-like domain-containing protein [Melia azedarach]
MDPTGQFNLVPGKRVPTIDVRSAKALLDNSDYGFLDVRSGVEFSRSHVDVPKVMNVPDLVYTAEGWLINHNFVDGVASICKEKDHLILGSQTGEESVHITAELLTSGYKNVLNMDGGYTAWCRNGFPLKQLGRRNPEDEATTSSPVNSDT